MAFVLLAGAGYAYYQQKQAENAYPLDPAVNLEGKSVIEFLPMELRAGSLVSQNATTTITFYKGDYRSIQDIVEQRVQEILKANPWLAGWCAQKPGETVVKLYYDPDLKDTAPSIFTVFEPGEIPLKRDTQFVQYKDICTDYAVKVPPAPLLIGKNLPIWKVTIVPDAVDHFGRFALIVSQSHFVGDNYTYYKLLHMLNPKMPVEALNPVRHQDWRQHVSEHMGATEAYYYEKATPDIVDQAINSYYNKGSSSSLGESDRAVEGNKIETLLFTISKDWLDYQTQQAIIEEERRQSNISTEFASERSRESILETSLRPAEVVLSWWFNTANADFGMYPHQLRKDLDILSEKDAGTYNNPIPYTRSDYATPQLIRDSILKGRRCGKNPETGMPEPLPPFTTGKSFAMGIDWNKHFPKGMDVDIEGIKEDLHIPLLMAEELATYTSKLSICLLFTASAENSPSGDRVGAFVVAKKEVCDRILASGIVDHDMKTSLTKELVNKRGSIIEFENLPDLESLGIDITLDDFAESVGSAIEKPTATAADEDDLATSS